MESWEPPPWLLRSISGLAAALRPIREVVEDIDGEVTATIDIGRHLDLTLEFSDGRLTGTDLGFGASHPRGDDKDDGLGGSGIASPQPSSVTPLQSTLFTYTLTYSGTHVQGTSGADLITVGTAAETVNAGDCLDVIVWNPPSIFVIGGPQMVILDGGAGADIYRLTADPGAPADLPGCLIFDFQGGGVSTSVSPDRAELQEFDPDSLVVTDLGDGFFLFDDGTTNCISAFIAGLDAA